MEDINFEKLRFAKSLILEGKIQTVNDLYQFLSKRLIANVIGLNPNSFSNSKSKRLGDFKLSELILLADGLNLPLELVVTLFYNSLNHDDHESFSIHPV